MKFGTVVLTLTALLWSVTSHTATPFITNKSDTREYAYLTLDNGLKVLLISDAEAEKSAAALDVNVGAGEDPNDTFGLAHFLEHMLFLGTEKYPTPGAFQSYVEGHGGGHNAYTSLVNTNYFFDIKPEYFDEALDRFAQFFIQPLFLQDYVERERQAVHSEYTSKISSSLRREKDVFRELAVPHHPLAKFSTGNADTLGVLPPAELRATLVQFFHAHYSADSMALVVLSPEPLAAMEAKVRPVFSLLPKRAQREKAAAKQLLFAEDFLPAEVHIQPKKNRRKLSVLFPVPSTRDYQNQKPLHYIGNLLGHEGKGSLLAVLKEQGWVTALSAGTQYSWREGEVFGLNILLTEKGLRYVDTIYALVFDAIALVSEEGVAQWRFQELADLSQIAFDFAESGDAIQEVSRLAGMLHETAAEKVLWQPYAFSEYSPDVFKLFLSKLEPNNALSAIVAPELEGTKRSHFYDTPYKVVTADHSLLQADAEDKLYLKLKKQLSLPKRNPFIAHNFDVIEAKSEAAKSAVPKKVVAKGAVTGWYLNDNIYDLPKTSIAARFKLPAVVQSPEHYVATKIYTRILQDALNDTSYEAALAGLSYSLVATTRGVDLEFYGYSDSIGELSDRVLKLMRKFNRSSRLRRQLAKEHFAQVRDELLRLETNRKHDKVYSQALRELPALLYSPYWSKEQVEAAYRSITEEQFLSVGETLFINGSVDVLVFGNIKSAAAKSHIKAMGKLLKKRKAFATSTRATVANLSESRGHLHTLEVNDSDSATVLYFQGESDALEEHARINVLEKMLSTPVYQNLRTEQQLGYIVFSSSYPIRRVPGLVVVVQSPTFSAQEVYQRISAFMREKQDVVLANIARDKQAVMDTLAELPSSQMEWADRFWHSILENDEKFDRIQRLLNLVDGLSEEALTKRYRKQFVEQAPSAVLTASKEAPTAHALSKAIERIDDKAAFKAGLPTYDYP